MILICYGTRPEWIKVKPVIDELGRRNIKHKKLFIKQHEDLLIGDHDYCVNVIDGYNRLDTIINHCMNIDCWNNITHTLVQGDTATAFGMALSSFHRKIPVIHLEAGLRTNDKENPYPEETYRKMISSITDIHLCPTDINAGNIFKDNCQGKRYVVGNTVLDSIDPKSDNIIQNKVLITMHRRENHHIMDKWFESINLIAGKYPELEFIIPIHPNPEVKKHRHLLYNVNVIEPVSRDSLIQLIKESNLVISDSGGLQEECSFLKRRIIVCRKVTERPETVGSTSFLCPSPDKLLDVFEDNIYKIDIRDSCPYGDGHSAEYVVDILEKL